MRTPVAALSLCACLGCVAPSNDGGPGDGEEKKTPQDAQEVAVLICDKAEECGDPPGCDGSEVIAMDGAIRGVGDPVCDAFAAAMLDYWMCYAEASCDERGACYLAPLPEDLVQQGAMSCMRGEAPIPVPDAWQCPVSAFNGGGAAAPQCSCGCGAPDPVCSGGGCTEAGCYADGCSSCFTPHEDGSVTVNGGCQGASVTIDDTTTALDVSAQTDGDGFVTEITISNADDSIWVLLTSDTRFDQSGTFACTDGGVGVTTEVDADEIDATTCELVIGSIPDPNEGGMLQVTFSASFTGPEGTFDVAGDARVSVEPF